MATRRHALVAARAATKATLLRRVPASGAVVLAYHDVGPEAERQTEYYVTPALLRRHLELVRRLGLSFVRLADLVTALQRDEPVDGLVAVAFDDAFLGVFTDARPVLEELGVPATVFAPTRCLGGEPTWWPGARALMSSDQLADLAGSGWEVGAHSRHHRQLVSLSARELDDELRGSRDDLDVILGAPPDLLAYPDGRHDARVRAAAGRAGFRAAFTFSNGRIERGDDVYRLARLTMGNHHGRLRLTSHLSRPTETWAVPVAGPSPARSRATR